MAVKILMLGGRRSGKTSILSTIIHSFNEQISSLCTIVDETDYSIGQGLDVPLKDKRIEIDNYLRNRQIYGNNAIFNVDMSPNNGEGSYKLRMKIGGTAPVELEFIDIPGEWMEQKSASHNTLKERAKECDIFIIAIDTPYLMQDKNPSITDVWNRVTEISNILSGININNEFDRKLILFVPVKGEKWLIEGQGDLIQKKICSTFATAINTWVNTNCVELWCLPVQTAGGIEHAILMDAYRVFMSANDQVGKICSRNEYTGTIYLKDGKTLLEQDVHSVSETPDKGWFMSYTQIPMSWYKTNGKGFAPKDCEQVGYQIIRFLVEKQKAITELTKKRLDELPWLIRQFMKLFSLPLGKYLENYTQLLQQLPIKTSGNGFCKITHPIKIDK